MADTNDDAQVAHLHPSQALPRGDAMQLHRRMLEYADRIVTLDAHGDTEEASRVAHALECLSRRRLVPGIVEVKQPSLSPSRHLLVQPACPSSLTDCARLGIGSPHRGQVLDHTAAREDARWGVSPVVEHPSLSHDLLFSPLPFPRCGASTPLALDPAEAHPP